MKKTCEECEKKFNTNTDSKTCYDCTLDRITGGNPPEEGDFNSAAIISGKMSDKEHQALMRELRDVELGRSRVEPYEEPEDNYPWMNRW